jgi:hypothetical protein
MSEPEQQIQTAIESELSMRRWSVISFDRCEASGLTYHQASEKLAELEQRRVPGLAIVTDEAAARCE